LFITAAHWALSFALFSTILFSLSYSGRRQYSALMSVLTIMGLSLIFSFCFSMTLDNWKSVPPALASGVPLGNKGLILSNSINRNETAVVLLNGSVDPFGPRVIAIPGEPLVFHETAAGSFDLPPIPFGDDTPWFLNSISIDVRLNAEMFQKKFNEGFFSFFIYAGSLIFLLCSLGYAIKISVWPVANLFLGTLAFCAILALSTFINTPETQEIMDSFLRGTINVARSVPLIFLGLGVLLHLYSFLIFIVRRRDTDEY
jgi:hypothetical protein